MARLIAILRSTQPVLIGKSTNAIERHPSLEEYCDLIHRIKALIQAIKSPQYTTKLNEVKYVLEYKDLHSANIMCDPSDPCCGTTSVLDWEFSSVVPAPRRNPPRALL